jgi:ribose transport system substrate-binding protein
MMGRWTSAILTVVVAGIAVSGCGSSDDENASTGTASGGASTAAAPASTAPKPSMYCGPECQTALTLQAAPDSVECKVGLSWNSAKHPYGATSIKRSEEAVKGFPNMELFVADGRGDAATQASQVEDLTARGIDVLIISPADAKALGGAVKNAEADGVKVIAADRSVDAPVVTYIGSDNVEAGAVAGKYVVELLGGKGNVVEIQGSLGASPTIDRGKGFGDALDGSGVKIVGQQSGDYDRAQGLKVMEDFLQRFSKGKIDAVFTHNDEMSLGAIQAIQEAGRDEIKVVGIDGQESALDAVEDGTYAGTVVYPIPVPEQILAAAKVCAGEELPTRIKQESRLVTKDDVAEFRGTTF